MKTMSNLNFFDVDKLDLEESAKDEIRLAILHGVDLTDYIKLGKSSEHLREYRLALQSGVPKQYINIRVDWEVLRYIRKLSELGYDLEFLDRYLPSANGKPTIEEDTLLKVLKCHLTSDTSDINFMYIKNDLVDGFIYGLSMGYDMTPLERAGMTLKRDVLHLLVSLIGAGIDVRPFIEKSWSVEQIEAILRSSHIVDPAYLVNNLINSKFTAGQIEEVARSLKYSDGLIVAQLDEDGYPLYNEYQMYELVEGLRFSLNVELYSNPRMSDFEMRKVRERLINQKETHGHTIRGKLRVLKPKHM